MTVTLDLAALGSDSHTRRSLTDLSLSVAKSKKIVVVTGAGISCSCGIPDFRSSDGLYALVKQKYPDVVLKGRDLFDASLFRDATSTAVFYTFISQLKQSIDSASPTPTHRFIKTLDSKKKLLRSYTQNIDGLEERVGLLGSSSEHAKSNGKGKAKIRSKDVRNVQLHGDIHRVRCMSCSAEYPCTPEHLTMFREGTPPTCPECAVRLNARVARSARPIRVGSLRPAIVLYDEPHPLGDDIGSIQSADVARRPELLIIMGTSLKVHGLRKLVKDFAKAVHASARSPSTSSAKPWAGKVIFVNRTPPAAEWADIIDYHVAGETDVWVDKVVEDWKKMRPTDWEVQRTLVSTDGDVSMSGAFKTVKDVLTPNTKGKARKPRSDEENLARMVLSTPDVSLIPVTKAPVPPLSPSKRRQTSSHYGGVESSPSKRRISAVKSAMADDERKLLFAESTNNQPALISEELLDLSMQDVEIPKPKTRAARAVRVKGGAVKSRAQATKAELVKTRTAATKAVAGKDSGRLRRTR